MQSSRNFIGFMPLSLVQDWLKRWVHLLSFIQIGFLKKTEKCVKMRSKQIASILTANFGFRVHNRCKYYKAKFCTFVQSEIIAPQQLNNSFGVAKLNSPLACAAHLAAAGNLAELVQFSSCKRIQLKKRHFSIKKNVFFLEEPNGLDAKQIICIKQTSANNSRVPL